MPAFILLLFGLTLAAQNLDAQEPSTLARVTAYWREEGQWRAAYNGTRLRNGHCAVDPKKIPYGSKVILRDEELIAVDTGPAVVSRKAARASGRNRAEKAALVVDHYFETRAQALAWEKSHPHFMQIQVVTPGKAKAVANSAPPPQPAAVRRTGSSLSPSTLVAPYGPALPLSWLGPAGFGGTTSCLYAASDATDDVLRSARRRTGGDLPLTGLRKGTGPLERLHLPWLRMG